MTWMIHTPSAVLSPQSYPWWGPLTLSVSEATAHVKELLDDDATLADLWVRGEVGDARTYASGHTY
ncbi:MAG: hypothetical protein ACRDI2_15820, partial [Chloroflexota bacterium]